MLCCYVIRDSFVSRESGFRNPDFEIRIHDSRIRERKSFTFAPTTQGSTSKIRGTHGTLRVPSSHFNALQFFYFQVEPIEPNSRLGDSSTLSNFFKKFPLVT